MNEMSRRWVTTKIWFIWFQNESGMWSSSYFYSAFGYFHLMFPSNSILLQTEFSTFVWLFVFSLFLWSMKVFFHMNDVQVIRDEVFEEYNKGRNFCSSVCQIKVFLYFFSWYVEWRFCFIWINYLKNTTNVGFFLVWRKIGDLFQEYNKGRSFSSSLESFLLQTDFSTYVWLFFVINEGYLLDEWCTSF